MQSRTYACTCRRQGIIAVALLTALLSAALPAQDTVEYQAGTKLRLQLVSGRSWITGGVTRITSDSIVLDSCSPAGCTILAYPWADVSRAMIRRRGGLSTAQRVTLIVASTVGGAAAGVAIGAHNERTCRDGPCFNGITTAFLGTLGTLGGLSFGATWDHERWRPVVRPQTR